MIETMDELHSDLWHITMLPITTRPLDIQQVLNVNLHTNGNIEYAVCSSCSAACTNVIDRLYPMKLIINVKINNK